MGSKHKESAALIKGGYFDNLTSFDEFLKRSKTLPNTKMVGDYLEVLVEGLLHTHHKFLAKRVCIVGNIDSDIAKKLNGINHESAGIDGVFEDQKGSLFPYQVKNYTKTTLNLKDLDTLKWGAGTGGELTFIFSTAKRLNKWIQKDKSVRGIMRDFFESLTPEDFAAVTNWLIPNNAKKTTNNGPFKPRVDQEEAIRNILKSFKTGKRAQIVVTCGGGKTLTAAELTRKMNKAKLRANSKPLVALLLVPNLTLVQQSIDDYKHQFGTQFRFMAVCSDDTAGQVEDHEGTLTLTDVDFVASTNINEIKAAMNEDHGNLPLIIFSTYHSQKQAGRAIKASRHKQFDLMICDEAHRTVNRSGSYCLFDKYIPAKKRLFMTATPRYRVFNQGQPIGKTVASMDNEDLYGPVVYSLSNKAAVDKGIVVKVKPVLSFLKDQTIKRDMLKKGFTEIEINNTVAEMGADWLAKQVGHARFVEKFDIEYSIMFLPRKRRVKMMAEHPVYGIQNVIPDSEGFYITGDHNSKQKKEIISRMMASKAKHKILVADRALNEGFNCKAIAGVHFTNPKFSVGDIKQCSGRPARAFTHPITKKKKLVAYALIDAHVMPKETISQALSRSNMDVLFKTITALMTVDEVLADQVTDALKGGHGPRIGGNAGDDIIVLVDAPDFDYNEIVDAVRVKVVERCVDDWSKNFSDFAKFFKTNKREPSHGANNKDENALAMWVAIQRYAHNKHNSLSAQRVKLLESIDGFVWQRREVKWKKTAQDWVAFRNSQGREPVVSANASQKERRLAMWAIRERLAYNEKTIDRERFNFLDSNNFTWQAQDKRWDDKLNEWLEYVKANGSEPTGRTENGLLIWVKNQRTKYRNNQLDKKRIQILESHGFTWEPRERNVLNKWDAKMVDCVAIFKKHKRLPTSKECNWLSKQRIAMRAGSLRKEQIAKLNNMLPGWDTVKMGGHRQNSGRKPR